MLLRAEEQQIYYEISMSIGTGLEYRKMLKDCLGKYLRKLNLSAGCLLRTIERVDGAIELEPFYQLPKKAAANRAIHIVNTFLQRSYDPQGLGDLKKELPFSHSTMDEEYAYFFSLPDFGILVLVKSGGPLDEHTINALAALNAKLANALNACLQKEALVESEHRLAEANERLAEFDADKLSFIQYISHELNTPLNWIGSLNMMESKSLSPENARYLDFVRKGFSRISTLAQLASSYFEEARQKRRGEMQQLDLRELESALQATLMPKLVSKELTLIFEGDWEGYLVADKEGLVFVLQVILENAVNFSAWEQSIRISFERADDKGTFSVTDRGVGIEAEDLRKVFKPCQMPEHKRSEGGYGFSLPRVNLICEANEWSLSVKSEGQGRGSCFSLSL
ncbi:HAMP domain-containing sensor histidine kinase [Pelagicoccus sp. SDUM812002]|uniref:sensor histidine kinase n=1 Tax=Pelagicoccus sp. SDUM812002 TaxID=3041266 RepID=UPI00280CE6E1|nr:HAMP domain-containing sensor histidine kinase [Pelagicoccus sp. SDUM812002]MDQ8188004.1 HAMP domain-containing sensor histidine kinase [Pelagicoccus sp. SDUM812002]